jgi:DNA mismatch repair protein MSH3
LLSAVDAEAARAGRATPATALKPDDNRFPELEGTRKAVADAIADLNDLLPELRDALVRGAENASTSSGAGKQKTLSAKLGGATKGKGAVSLVPACLGYVTVALVEHLIELPETLEGVPHDWVRVSTNKSKKVVRYHPPAVLERAAALERARERHAGACEAAWRRFLSVECAGRFLELRGAVRAAAGLDALCSFAALARQEGYCCPTFLDADETDETDERGDAFLDIREGRHPILDATLIGGDSVVPNSVRLGSARAFGKRLESFPSGTESFPVLEDISDSPYSAFSNEEENPRALVVTGPNMGGKSCFVRQTALLVLMAQCGSFTPARAMTLTPFEGVHTRMGAADNLAMGSSTFLEEMSECASILNAVTREKRSLVVLDELGRGTSTHDGVAVAHATLEHLVGARAGGSRPDGSFGEENASSSSSSSRGTLTLFVTHYPSVAREVVAKRPRECAAAFTSYAEKRRTRSTTASGSEAEDETDLRAEKNADEALAAADEIDFLYALTPGVAHRSFGLNVARMAGVPPGVLRSAAAKARELETGMSRKAAARVASEARRDGGFGGAGERALLGACAEIADAAGAVVRALRDAGDVEAVAAAQARAREATREGREDVR